MDPPGRLPGAAPPGMRVGAVFSLLSVRLAASTFSCDSDAYYAGVNLSEEGAALQAALQARISSPHVVIPYTSSSGTDAWDALKVLDADPTDASKVIPIYTQSPVDASLSGQTSGWNREHLWPKSYGVGYSGPDFSDLHMLRASDWNVNSARNNLYFDRCDGCTSPAHAEAAPDTAKNSEAFRPPASVKGDIARAIFYMAVRYNGAEESTENLQLTRCPCDVRFALGNLDALLAWNEEDPVDDAELARNGAVCSGYQGNRNPFIDHPSLVSKLWTAGAADAICDSGCSANPTPSPAPQPGAWVGQAGDCAVVGFQAGNPDDLAVLLLVDFPAGAKLYVTDDGVLADGSLRRNEGIQSAVLAGPRAAGTVLTLADFASDEEGTLALSSSGDQVIVFSGSADAPTYLCALNAEGQAQWQATATSSSTSGLPPGLENGISAVAIAEADSAAYQGIMNGTAAELRSAINDAGNWAGSDGSRLEMPTSFAVQVPPSAEATTTTRAPAAYTAVSSAHGPSSTSTHMLRRCIQMSAPLVAMIQAVRWGS